MQIKEKCIQCENIIEDGEYKQLYDSTSFELICEDCYDAYLNWKHLIMNGRNKNYAEEIITNADIMKAKKIALQISKWLSTDEGEKCMIESQKQGQDMVQSMKDARNISSEYEGIEEFLGEALEEMQQAAALLENYDFGSYFYAGKSLKLAVEIKQIIEKIHSCIDKKKQKLYEKEQYSHDMWYGGE